MRANKKLGKSREIRLALLKNRWVVEYPTAFPPGEPIDDADDANRQ